MTLNLNLAWLIGLLLGGTALVEDTTEPGELEFAGHYALQRTVAGQQGPSAAFVTDGCSGGLSGTWRLVAENFPDFAAAHSDTPPWEECCVVHDRSYHAGGFELSPEQGFQARLAADEALRQCVESEGSADAAELAIQYETTEAEIMSAYRSIGAAMFVAVRYGGLPCSGFPWRWGYGSAQCLIQSQDFKRD